MTKKDYIKFANMLHEIKPERHLTEGDTHYAVLRSYWVGVVFSMSTIFKEDNSRFDMTRFENACETGDM